MMSIEKILRFGRDLHLMGEQLKREKGRNEENEKALKVVCSTFQLMSIFLNNIILFLCNYSYEFNRSIN